MERRTFLRQLGTAGATGALTLVAAACGARPSAPRITSPAKSAGRLHELDGLAVADWLIAENADPRRTRRWIISRKVPGSFSPPIEGYLDKVSAAKGEEITLYVNTAAATFRAFVYRIGYYGGFGGRLIARSPELRGRLQPPPTLVGGVNTVECGWPASWRTTVGEDWPPGMYLIRLEASRSAQQYVPLVVRDDASTAAYLLQSSVTTWQAYNPFGGYSLYGGPPAAGRSDFENRARVVSFDRPYGHSATALDARGSGDFLGNELPLLYLAERHGLDLAYWTDVDLARRTGQLDRHRCLVSLGHDEYWSMSMREGVEAAIAKGLNVAFLGANACYRQIRLESSPLGSDRRVVCYKDAAEDPITRSDPALATGGSWATDPVPRPESAFIGIMYRSYGANAPFVVADESSFVFAGTNLRNGDKIDHVVGSEIDGFEPMLPHPSGVQLLGHSPAHTVSGATYSDMSYYSAPGGGGVFASGTGGWVSALWDGAPATASLLGFAPRGAGLAALTTVTLNVLRAFGAGPASVHHRSSANWRRFYSPEAAPIAPQDVA